MIWLLLLLALFPDAVTGQNIPAKPKRVPLEKVNIILKSPTKYERRIIGQDPRTGQPLYYDPKPRVIVLDAKARKYGLRWIGYDRKEKTITYQRPDAVDVVVSASVSRVIGGQYLYVYDIMNLPTSMEYVSTFAVQNHSSKVSPIKSSQLYVGGITRNGKEFKAGNWIGFGVLSGDVTPGKHFEVKLLSSAPPGLVECRVAGVLGMKGVGEEPPQELENVLPGYEIWPHGYTLGPMDQLSSFSQRERAKYIRGSLPQIRRLGWATPATIRWYEQSLDSQNLNEVIRRADEDFKQGVITSELHDMIKLIQ
jgi:hypothetical protein